MSLNSSNERENLPDRFGRVQICRRDFLSNYIKSIRNHIRNLRITRRLERDVENGRMLAWKILLFVYLILTRRGTSEEFLECEHNIIYELLTHVQYFKQLFSNANWSFLQKFDTVIIHGPSLTLYLSLEKFRTSGNPNRGKIKHGPLWKSRKLPSSNEEYKFLIWIQFFPGLLWPTMLVPLSYDVSKFLVFDTFSINFQLRIYFFCWH